MTSQASIRVGRLTGAVRRRLHLLPYMLALPIIIYEAIFILIPILQEIASSFASDVIGGGPVRWVGLANYERMLKDQYFWKAIGTTLVYMVFVVITSVGLGLISALLINQRFRGRAVVRGIITLPWAFPDVPTVLIFLWMLNPSFGILNVVVRALGVPDNPRWLIDAGWAMPAVIGIVTWKAFPFYGLVILAALQTIPHELYEAAKVDGASTVQSFRYVTLPSIAPTLTLMGLLAAIFAFRQFALIWLSSGGGPAGATETLVIRVYQTAFRFFDFSYAATLGVAGFLTVFVIGVVFVILQRRRALEVG